MLDSFYSTVASLSFALLGLWWVVVQFKADLWLTDPVRRRRAYGISLYFLLPGLMSLLSLLAAEATWLWRVGFGVAGVMGMIEAVTILAGRPTSGAAGGTRAVTASHVATLILYALVVVVAAWIGLPDALGLDLRSLVIEGILVTLILLLGVNLAWRYFVETAPTPSSPSPPA
jgi:hypothetical protein